MNWDRRQVRYASSEVPGITVSFNGRRSSARVSGSVGGQGDGGAVLQPPRGGS